MTDEELLKRRQAADEAFQVYAHHRREMDAAYAARYASAFRLSADGRDLLRRDIDVRAGVIHDPTLGLCTQVMGPGRAFVLVSVKAIRDVLLATHCDVL